MRTDEEVYFDQYIDQYIDRYIDQHIGQYTLHIYIYKHRPVFWVVLYRLYMLACVWLGQSQALIRESTVILTSTLSVSMPTGILAMCCMLNAQLGQHQVTAMEHDMTTRAMTAVG